MTDEQFKVLLKKISDEKTVPTPEIPHSVVDAIPIPTGWKTIIGLIGALTAAGGAKAGLLDPNSQWVELAIYAFTALGGLGLIAKLDRLIKIAIKVLGYAPMVVTILERIEAEAKKNQPQG